MARKRTNIMKKALLSASMLALVGCSDVQYRFNGESLPNNTEWEDAGVSFGNAQNYEKNGISYDTYEKLSYVGITSIEEIKALNSVFPVDEQPIEYFMSHHRFHPDGLLMVAEGLRRGDFTLADISGLLREADRRNSLGGSQRNVFGMGPYSALVRPLMLTSSARNIHRGESVSDAVTAVIKLERENDKKNQALSEELDRENQPTPEEETQRKKQWENTEAYLNERGRIQLQQMGMTPDMAQKGIWAATHRPNSECAYYIHQLTADADMQRIRPDLPDTGGNTLIILKLEQSHMCDSGQVEKSITPPETPLQRREKEQLRHSHVGGGLQDVEIKWPGY